MKEDVDGFTSGELRRDTRVIRRNMDLRLKVEG